MQARIKKGHQNPIMIKGLRTDNLPMNSWI